MKSNLPPLAVIFDDPDRKWTFWDTRLIKAMELHAELTAGGIPVYWDKSERVRFEVKSTVSKYKAALDRAEEKAREGEAKNYGKSFYAVPITIDGGPLPSLEEYLEQERQKKLMMKTRSAKFDVDPFSNANWAPELN